MQQKRKPNMQTKYSGYRLYIKYEDGFDSTIAQGGANVSGGQNKGFLLQGHW